MPFKNDAFYFHAFWNRENGTVIGINMGDTLRAPVTREAGGVKEKWRCSLTVTTNIRHWSEMTLRYNGTIWGQGI